MPSKSLSLLLTLLVASCGLDLTPSTGAYQVKSDCPDAKTKEGQLELANDYGSILGVGEVKNAVDFGFPSNFFGYSLGGSFQVTGSTRECKSQLFKKNTKNFVFLCRENAANLCTITFNQ